MPRLLIVDDEENVRNALKRWFELGGFEVDLAEDGGVAIERVNERHYDAITMDLQMPRMSGTQAIEEIKRIRPDIPVVILTGFHSHPGKVTDSGASKVMTKPVSLRDLEGAIRSLIEAAAHES